MEGMVKPIMNIDQVEFDDVEVNGAYTSSRGQISDCTRSRASASDGPARCSFRSVKKGSDPFLTGRRSVYDANRSTC
jgi:hypothetical protein